MQKAKLDCLKCDGRFSRSLHMAHAGSNAGATGVHRSVALHMQLVIARLFREPHLEFTRIGDGWLCGHTFAS